MKIQYRETKEFSSEEIERLFLSVNWSSGYYPKRLQEALRHYGYIIAAYDGDKLIGMVCAMDDKTMTAYIHYVLVDPDYQGRGIGRSMMEQAKQHYREYLRIVLVAYDREKAFYEHLGFSPGAEETPMFLTSLWT